MRRLLLPACLLLAASVAQAQDIRRIGPGEFPISASVEVPA